MKQGTEVCSIFLATRGDVMRWQGAALRGGFAVYCLVRLGGAFLPIAIPDVPELRHFSCFEGMLLKKRFRIRSCGRLEVGWRGKSCRFPMKASLRKIRIYKAPVQSYARLRYIVTPSHSRNSTYFQPATTSNFGPKIQQHGFAASRRADSTLLLRPRIRCRCGFYLPGNAAGETHAFALDRDNCEARFHLFCKLIKMKLFHECCGILSWDF